ncbi:MFS transporter [Xenorhabdus sp. PB62.4]|uniref:MFS transporter n=1 Tax=Xenorhabdus sp. PB62.4 TaxID=1851573 RepID=UPI0016571173|nr:MFS transporter [Xenorhabdus sp. PB62.4]MBC8952671.1 MFS transporter [Xenorhabdus sp. PB62.4]
MIKYIGIGANEFDTYLDYAIFNIIAIYLLHSDPLQLGILGACFSLPFLFSSYLFGKLFDRYEIRRFRILLFSANACVIPFIGLGGSILVLYATAFIKTLVRSGINISNTKLNKDDEETSRFYEIYGYLISISRIIIPLIVIGAYGLWGIWFVVGLSVILNLVASLSTFLDHTQYHHSEISQVTEPSESYSFLKIMLKKQELGILVTAYTISNLAFYLSNDMLGIFFKVIGQDENSIGIIISLMGLGSFAGTKLASFLIKRIIAKSVLLYSILTNATAFTCFGFLPSNTTSVLAFYSAIVIVGISSGITFFAVRYGVRNTVGYENVGKTTGIIQMLSALVAIIMPIIGGVIANYYGIDTTFRITSIIFCITLIYFILFVKKIKGSIYMYNSHKLSEINLPDSQSA